jgi:pyruvate/2-oxoglutarate/acetoin dehydrogenase E1 component
VNEAAKYRYRSGNEFNLHRRLGFFMVFIASEYFNLFNANSMVGVTAGIIIHKALKLISHIRQGLKVVIPRSPSLVKGTL